MSAGLVQPAVSAAPSQGSLAWHARLLVLSQLIRRTLRVAVLIVAARLLGVSVFGSYVLLLTVVEMVAIVSGCGYMDFLTREIARGPESAWPLGRKMSELRLLCIMPSLLLALLILAALRFPTAVLVNVAWLSLSLIPRAFTESAQGMMKGVRRFALLPWIELAQGTVVLSTAPVLILRGLGSRGMLAAEILGALAGVVVSMIGVARWFNIRTSAVPSRCVLFRSALAFNFYPFLTTIYDRVDVVLLAKMAGDFAIGVYSLPYRAFASLQILPYGIMGALLPVMSRPGFERDAAQTCAQAMKILLLTALLLVLATFTFAGPLVRLVFGPSFAASIWTVQLLIWAAVPAFMNFALNTLLIASGREPLLLRATVICTAFNIGANLLLIPRYSFFGAAAVTVLTECLLFSQNLFYARQVMGKAVLPKDGGRIVAAFVVVGGCAWVLARTIPGVWAGSLGICAFLAFALVSGSGMPQLFPPAAREHTS